MGESNPSREILVIRHAGGPPDRAERDSPMLRSLNNTVLRSNSGNFGGDTEMTILPFIPNFRDRHVLRYAIAVLLSLAALWVRVFLDGVFDGYPFLTFFPAVLLAALLGGLGPGLMAMILCGLLAQYFLIGPKHSLEIAEPSGWIALGIYGATAAGMVGLVHKITLAYEGQLETKNALSELNRTLEEKVALRTAELQAEIADRIAAEDQVRQMQKMEAVSQLTGGIAHDFNNMLTLVIGALDLAKVRAEAQNDPRITKYIGVAQEGAQRAASLTSRLLAFARQQPLEPQAVNINELVSGLSLLLQRTLGDHIKVEMLLDKRIWHCFADPSQLENALMNLVINARDAMPDGGLLAVETANIELGSEQVRKMPLSAGQYVRVTVRDTGTGIAPEAVERVFEPFYTTKGVGKGTGLGLSQVHGFVTQSGGHIRIMSTPGIGTLIELLLPRFVGQIASSVSSTGDDVELGRTGAQTVLVVEDEGQVRDIVVNVLSELGYLVHPAEGPDQALQQLKELGRVDLLLTDVMMPSMSGTSLASEARALYPEVKVLYMTGYAPESIIPDNARKAGMAVLRKPFSVEQLAKAVRNATTN